MFGCFPESADCILPNPKIQETFCHNIKNVRVIKKNSFWLLPYKIIIVFCPLGDLSCHATFPSEPCFTPRRATRSKRFLPRSASKSQPTTGIIAGCKMSFSWTRFSNPYPSNNAKRPTRYCATFIVWPARKAWTRSTRPLRFYTMNHLSSVKCEICQSDAIKFSLQPFATMPAS